MEREKRKTEEIKPLVLLLKVAIPLAFPLAGFILSTLTTNSRTRTAQLPCPPQEHMDSAISVSRYEHGEDERSHSLNSSSMCQEKGEQEPEKREPSISLRNSSSLEIRRVQYFNNMREIAIKQSQDGPNLEEDIETPKSQIAALQEKDHELDSSSSLEIRRVRCVNNMREITIKQSQDGTNLEEDIETLKPQIAALQEKDHEVGSSSSLEIRRVQCFNNMREIAIKQAQDGPNLEEDIETLKSEIAALQEKEHELDSQIYHHHNLKEQESLIQKLQIMCLGFKLESLEAQHQRLEGTIVELRDAMKQHDMMKDVLKLLQRKVKMLQKTNRLHARLIHRQALNLDAIEVESSSAKEELKQAAKEIKDSAEQLHQNNKAMEEKPDQRTMMNPSASKNGKELMMEDDGTPRLSKKELLDRLERFRAQWYADMEEVIYLGWIGACLRHEILMNQKEEDEKPVGDHLVDDRANNCIIEFQDSDGSSSAADLGDDSMVVALMKHHSGSTKPRLLHKIKGWAKGKGRSKGWCDRDRSFSERWCGSQLNPGKL